MSFRLAILMMALSMVSACQRQSSKNDNDLKEVESDQRASAEGKIASDSRTEKVGRFEVRYRPFENVEIDLDEGATIATDVAGAYLYSGEPRIADTLFIGSTDNKNFASLEAVAKISIDDHFASPCIIVHGERNGTFFAALALPDSYEDRQISFSLNFPGSYTVADCKGDFSPGEVEIPISPQKRGQYEAQPKLEVAVGPITFKNASLQATLSVTSDVEFLCSARPIVDGIPLDILAEIESELVQFKPDLLAKGQLSFVIRCGAEGTRAAHIVSEPFDLELISFSPLDAFFTLVDPDKLDRVNSVILKFDRPQAPQVSDATVIAPSTFTCDPGTLSTLFPSRILPNSLVTIGLPFPSLPRSDYFAATEIFCELDFVTQTVTGFAQREKRRDRVLPIGERLEVIRSIAVLSETQKIYPLRLERIRNRPGDNRDKQISVDSRLDGEFQQESPLLAQQIARLNDAVLVEQTLWQAEDIAAEPNGTIIVVMTGTETQSNALRILTSTKDSITAKTFRLPDPAHSMLSARALISDSNTPLIGFTYSAGDDQHRLAYLSPNLEEFQDILTYEADEYLGYALVAVGNRLPSGANSAFALTFFTEDELTRVDLAPWPAKNHSSTRVNLEDTKFADALDDFDEPEDESNGCDPEVHAAMSSTGTLVVAVNCEAKGRVFAYDFRRDLQLYDDGVSANGLQKIESLTIPGYRGRHGFTVPATTSSADD